MANWQEANEKAKPAKRARFKGIRKSGKDEAATPHAASRDGLREERRQTVEAYYGVYPADAAARNRANNDLRYPPARLEATA
jgi:hypothetical protein